VPAYDDPTDTLTIPAQAGVQYFLNGDLVPAGDIVLTADAMVESRTAPGYVFTQGVDNDWFYNYTP
jgi:ssRNA-specific RNase YbeY (16S rRNA maturation enzyme)